MVDRIRVLSKLDELEAYLKELRSVLPKQVEQYQLSATKRACERLLQLCIECTIDISKKLVIGQRLGVPQDEVDVFEKLRKINVFSEDMLTALKRMRALRNILVHEYTDVQDDKVFEVMSHHLDNFQRFQEEIREYLRSIQ